MSKTCKPRVGNNGQLSELDLVQVRSLFSIRPSPENDDIYGVVSWEDPEVIELARSIQTHGVQEPILIRSSTPYAPLPGCSPGDFLKVRKREKRKPSVDLTPVSRGISSLVSAPAAPAYRR